MLDYIQLYPETLSMVKRYPPADRALLYEAMVYYGTDGTEPDWPEDDLKWFVWESLRQRVDAAAKKSAAMAENGRKGGSKQKQTEANESKPEQTEANESTESEPDTEAEAESESDAEAESEKTSTKHAREELTDRFERFWKAYPRHTDKKKAQAAFLRIKPDEDLLNTMLEAIARQRSSPQWREDQFIPHPTTWLNGARWNDEIKSTQPPPKLTSQTNYDQREYQEASPGQLAPWLREMMTQEEIENAAAACCG